MDVLRSLSDSLEGVSWWVAVGLFLALAAYESVRPERRHGRAALGRWLIHFTLYAAGLVLVFEVAPQRLSTWFFGDDGPHSIFADIADRGGAIAVLVTGCLLVDLLVYATHRIHHAVFFLWRFHAVHHADAEMDLTTTLRHHPVEFLANGIYIAAVCAALGVPAWVFPFYATLSLAVGQFQHMNGQLHPKLDAALRWVIVTPAMHRIHHSVEAGHYNSNFGSVFSLWDRLLGTNVVVAPSEEDRLVYGIADTPSQCADGLRGALLLPLVMRKTPQRVHDPVFGPGD